MVNKLKFNNKWTWLAIGVFVLSLFGVDNSGVDNSRPSGESLKDLVDDYRDLHKEAYELWEDYKDNENPSRKEKEAYGKEKSAAEKVKKEFLSSMETIETFTGRCYLENASYSQAADQFDMIISAMSDLSEAQYKENYPNWSISCRERKEKEDEGLFDADTRGSDYSFNVSEKWLTEDEIELLDNIKKGDVLYFTASNPTSITDTSLIRIQTPRNIGLNLKFTNETWDAYAEPIAKSEKKTIYFYD